MKHGVELTLQGSQNTLKPCKISDARVDSEAPCKYGRLENQRVEV